MTSAIKRSTLMKKVKSKSMDISGPSVLDLPVLRRKRTLALNRMRKALEIAELVKSNTSDLNTFRAYYSSVQKWYSNFEEAHSDILSVVDDSCVDGEDLVRSEFDDIYFQLLTLHNELVQSTTTHSTESVQVQSSFKLPRLDLPKFSGDIKSWPMFFDSFNSLIHLNKSLSNSDRMQYLRSSLHGEALGLIRTFPVEGSYYEAAFNTLVGRYRDNRELAFTCWREMQQIDLKSSSPIEFRRVLDLFNENLVILKGLDLPIEQWDFVLCYLLLSKLDSKTRCAFEQAHPTPELPRYETLKEFLYSQCEAFVRDTHFSSNRDSNKSNKSSSNSNNKIQVHSKSNNFKPMTSSFLSNVEKSIQRNDSFPNKSRRNNSFPPNSKPGNNYPYIPNSKCIFCDETHSISYCKSFAERSAQERHNIARERNWCFNCLKPSHSLKQCHSVFKCKICHQRHHTLLHTENSTSEAKPQINDSIRVLTNLGDSSSVVLLSTAAIQIRDSSGGFQTLRALIDSGSQGHFVTERAAKQLGLEHISTKRHIRGLGQSTASVSGAVQLQINVNGRVAFNVEALTLPNICGNMPSVQLDKSSWLNIRGLNLADPDCDKPGPIDILLGAELFPSLILPGSVRGEPPQPAALNSVFGWLLLGSVGGNTNNVNSFFVSDNQLSNEVKRFWELDNLPSTSKLSSEDQRCEDIYRKSTTRDSSGRFTVALPFKEDKEFYFPGSRDKALRRFHSLERKLLGDPVLKEQYAAFMDDYLECGHMSPVPTQDLPSGKFYIPHHCVLRPDSVSTKLRVVFDASCKDAAAGVSLNETLLIGPKLQACILEILLRFRTHLVVFSADVCKMYRQIMVKREHRDYQRIFWRSHPSEQLREYRLNTVTYGVSSAPFLACRTIQQLTDDEGNDLPLAKAILQNDVYIDDVVSGCPSMEEASRAKAEIIELLQRGGMSLRKWSSNKPELLSDLPPEYCLTDPVSMDVEESNPLKILGLKWDPKYDHFTFEVNPLDRKCSKRTILSELARVYDPLGFLSPLTFFAKLLVQKLWVLDISWDEDPPEAIQRQWSRYTQELPAIASLRIPRRLSVCNPTSCEIHGFADSSELGYGAVIYLRVCDRDNNVKVFFVMSKARVAPIKKVSLPRLELCAAVMLSDLLRFVNEIFSRLFPISDIYAWSDSTVALSWIRSSSSRWKTFVANRVSHIQDTIPGAHWQHVPSSSNPADIASRGQTPAELVQNALWWAGPDWLCQASQYWPTSNSDPPVQELRVEEKVQVLLACATPSSHPIDHLLNRFSSIRKVQRIVGYWLRFIRNLKDKQNRCSDLFLNRAELHNALLTIVKRIQTLHFSEEINRLKEGKLLSKHMRKLNPFLDDRGVLRVGGRLSRSGLEFSHKHPALLPRQASLTDRIIDAFHRENCHPGINTLHYLISQQFWIVSAKRAIRNRVSKCIQCYKTNPTPLEPYMSDLPSVRVNQVKPFSIVGVDYAGPFRIKSGKHRGAKISKAYLCLFVCFTTKALHLEVATELTSEAFIAALRRFVGRRGRVSTIYSDCGTNFVGAARELSSFMQSASHAERIVFKFNPPASPHFGGVWEIQVKAVKSHLYRIVGTQCLTLDELFTLFIQIEAMLNSRPLYPLSSDPNDFSVLTPGHFLTLEPLTSVPDEDLTSTNLTRLRRWQLIQRFQQDFWKRWRNEYLQSLTQRAKWTKHLKPLEIGSVVILKSEAPPLHWQLARVEQLHTSPDGLVRIVTVRLPTGSFLTRPLTKVCPLPNLVD